MFINLSNHPSEKWSDKQLEEARKYGTIYGKIIDMPFPQISPTATSEEIDELVNEYYQKILESIPIERIIFINNEKSFAVLVQGEFVFTYRLVNLLKDKGIIVVAARTERKVKELVENGIPKKVSEFNFAGFMEY